MEIYSYITSFETGLRRGYIRVADRKESEYIALPESLKGIRGNTRRAMELFKRKGCTHYTMQDYQSNSTQYCLTIYRGYRKCTCQNCKHHEYCNKLQICDKWEA